MIIGNLKPFSILIADDHNVMRKTLRMWLQKKFPNMQIIEAYSGEQALELLEGQDIQIVLMDINLNGTNGITTTIKIKELYPKMAVIVLSIQESERYQTESKHAGADAYVIKRKMYTELIPKMQSFL